MSTTHDESKPMTETGSATSGGQFLPAPAYGMPIDRLLSAAGGVQVEKGLPTVEVQKRHQLFGENQLTEAPPVPTWQKLVAQFKDLVIWILIVAAVISGALGEWVDALAILAIVLLNGVIGFVQEQRAEQAMSALRKLSAPSAKVVRDGTHQTVPAGTLVPGDIIQVEVLTPSGGLHAIEGDWLPPLMMAERPFLVYPDSPCRQNQPAGRRLHPLDCVQHTKVREEESR